MKVVFNEKIFVTITEYGCQVQNFNSYSINLLFCNKGRVVKQVIAQGIVRQASCLPTIISCEVDFEYIEIKELK